MATRYVVTEPETFAFDGPVTAMKVRIAGGAVNVVGTHEDGARVEISEIKGPPLRVVLEDGVLTVAYEDLPWQGFLKWLDPKGRNRAAVVSLAVPADTRVEVGVIGASAVVSGISGPTDIRGVTGDTTLVGIEGAVRADTVSGHLEAQALTGDLRFHSVSGGLTVIDGGSAVRAESVSGDMVIDAARPADLTLNSVSGEIAVRLPNPPDTEVSASTTSGSVSNAFKELETRGQWGGKRIEGRLGQGKGTLKAATVSGALALLRRPPGDDDEATAPAADKKVL